MSELFLKTSASLGQEAVDQGLFYGDELDADGGRSRWTRQRARVHVGGLGSYVEPLTLVVTARGWPGDVLDVPVRQPTVRVVAGGRELGSFDLHDEWRTFSLAIPPDVATSSLEVLFESSHTFLSTATYGSDNRPKGMRLRALELSSTRGASTPDGQVVLGAAAVVLLAYLAQRRLRVRPWIGVLPALALALWMGGLVAFARIWALPIITGLLALLLLLLLLTLLTLLRQVYHLLARRLVSSGALQVGLLVSAVLTLLALAIPPLLASPPLDTEGLRTRDPEALIQGLLIVSLLLISLINMGSMSRVVRWIRLRMLLGRWAHLLFIALLGTWLLYEWSVVVDLPFVGHADYADNAVVARNLVRGRGWMVDYVTQFYEFRPDGNVVRPQETWPLLQPVWIAPFFALFGPQAWAAKIPNLIFNLLLALAIFWVATRLWDRRVGLIAALLTLTNQFFFFLTIYTTNDLGLVLFSFGALALFFFAHERRSPRLLLGAGLLAGLMALQKPGTGVLLGLGLGLWWLIMRRWAYGLGWRQMLLRWALPAALVFSPYIVRNIVEFGTPLHTTESIDAWVLGFGSDEEIYKVYAPVEGMGEQGVPDRSWILRWGYGRTVQKILTQVKATRNYLLPPLPFLGGLGGVAQLLGVVTTWLAFAGAVSRWGRARGSGRLLGLLLAAFGPYMIFLWVYWHANEERYFLPLVPWLALLAGVGLLGIFDLMVEAWSGRLAIVAAAFTALLLVLGLQQIRPDGTSGWTQISRKLEQEPASWALDLQAFEWLRQNTPPDSVIMTRVPWQLSFHADRRALMTPNIDDILRTLRVGRHYGADYIVVNAMTNEKEAARRALSILIGGEDDWGFKRVHAVQGENRTIYIFKFPADYAGQPEIMRP